MTCLKLLQSLGQYYHSVMPMIFGFLNMKETKLTGKLIKYTAA